MTVPRPQRAQGGSSRSMARTGWPWTASVPGQRPYRSGFRPILGERGMVSAAHPLAAQAGLDVLRSGGNAVDAAVATSAALMVVVPMQCSPGGDAFWLIAPPDAPPQALNASGVIPESANADELRALGHSTVPTRSAWAVTVPGAVAGWATALERFGTRSLDEVLKPAITIAEQGFIIGRHLRASIVAAEPLLRASQDGVEWFLRSGIPALYDKLVQPLLADTLRQLGRSGGKSLYNGQLAEAIADAVVSRGGWLSESDLARCEPRWDSPLSVQWRGLEIFQPPPNTQGTVLLAALRTVDGRDSGPLKLDASQAHHLLIEALRAARADCESHVMDPAYARLKPDALLDESYLRLRAAMISPTAAQPTWTSAIDESAMPGPVGRERDGDTAHLAVVDCDGMAVSLTQSLFDDFGSGVPVTGHGFFLQNRASSSSLQRGAPNELQGGHRPPHTLVPGLALDGGQVRFVLGAMGGTGQPQTQLQLLVQMVDEGLDPAEAIAAPRWYSDVTTREQSRVYVESRLSRRIVDELKARGHDIVRLGPWEELMGHAQVIEVNSGGVLVGGADPRSDGAVAAW
jgi:gamma-glutamyltranspeptidase